MLYRVVLKVLSVFNLLMNIQVYSDYVELCSSRGHEVIEGVLSVVLVSEALREVR